MKKVRKKAAQITGQRGFFSGGKEPQDGDFGRRDDSGGADDDVSEASSEYDYVPDLESGNYPYLVQPDDEIDFSSTLASQRGVDFAHGFRDGFESEDSETDYQYPPRQRRMRRGQNPTQSPRKSVLRPIRKAASRLTGAQGFFSGKGDEGEVDGDGASGTMVGDEASGKAGGGSGGGGSGDRVRQSPEVRSRLGYQQALHRLDNALHTFWYPDEDEDVDPVVDGRAAVGGTGPPFLRCCSHCGSGGSGGCCRGMLKGFLGPLRATAAGESQRERIKKIVPWSAVAVMGAAIVLNAATHVLVVGRHYGDAYFDDDDEASNDNTEEHDDVLVYSSPTSSSSSSSSFKYDFSDAFAALAVSFGILTYLICWLLGLRIACAGPRNRSKLSTGSCAEAFACCTTDVPLPHWHRMLAAVPVLGVSVLVAYAPWLMVLTTCLTIVPQYFINIAYCLIHQTVHWMDVAAGITAALVIVLTPAHIIVSTSLRNDARLANRRRVVYERYLQDRRRHQRSARQRQLLADGEDNEILQVVGSERRRSVSRLYFSRLWDVLLVITAPMLLDLCQCLPLLGSYIFMEDIGSRKVFLGLLLAFIVPRTLLLGLSFIQRRISFNQERGLLELSSFDHVSILGHLLGMGAYSKRDRNGDPGRNQHLAAEEADRLISRAEEATANPLGPAVTRIRNWLSAILIVVFPLTPSLFLILDNIAKVNATATSEPGGAAPQRTRASVSGSTGGGGLSTLSAPLTGSFTSDGSSRRDNSGNDNEDGCCCCCGGGCYCCEECLSDCLFQCCCCVPCLSRRDVIREDVRRGQHRSADVLRVSVGPEDRCNAAVYAFQLILAYGSQAYLLFTKGGALWPLAHGKGFLGGASGAVDFLAGAGSDDDLDDDYVKDARATIMVIVLAELLLAVGLAAAVRCCLGTALWRRVRVLFENRASLWLSAAARDRRTGALVISVVSSGASSNNRLSISSPRTSVPGEWPLFSGAEDRFGRGEGGGGLDGGGGWAPNSRSKKNKRKSERVPTAIALPAPQTVATFVQPAQQATTTTALP